VQALWLADRNLTFRNDLPVPEPLPGESLVRILRAGICNTDLELVRGYYPFSGIPGHEFVGIVERGPRALAGRRVVGEINAGCGRCPACLAGGRSHCPSRTVLGIVRRDGAFAEYLTLPSENLHLVPESVPTGAACFVEPLAAALEVQEQVPIRKGDRVLVAGDGKLGQLIARTLALTGCDLLVAGRNPAKLDLLRSAGIPTAPPAAVAGGSFDVAVECTGSPEGFTIARRALRPRGTLVLKSTYAGSMTLDASSLVVDEITVVGSRCGPFDKAISLLAERRVDVAPLVHARYPLSEGLAAFEHAARRGVLKVVIEVEGDGG